MHVLEVVQRVRDVIGRARSASNAVRRAGAQFVHKQRPALSTSEGRRAERFAMKHSPAMARRCCSRRQHDQDPALAFQCLRGTQLHDSVAALLTLDGRKDEPRARAGSHERARRKRTLPRLGVRRAPRASAAGRREARIGWRRRSRAETNRPNPDAGPPYGCGLYGVLAQSQALDGKRASRTALRASPSPATSRA